MTRLVTEDIREICSQLPGYDNELISKTGCTLRQLACYAVEFPEDVSTLNLRSRRAAVVPVTAGEGLIDGFSETVMGILRHLGLNAYVTSTRDASGIAEAYEGGAELIFMADDDRFICLMPSFPQVIDNIWATARGFSAALDLMYRGVKGQDVLVLGCGTVGSAAAFVLAQMGGKVSLYDILPEKAQELAERLKRARFVVSVVSDLDEAMDDNRLVLEATNSAGVIDARHIVRDTFVAAPGMPLGLTPEAVEQIGKRLLHDPLQIGVAVMAMEGIKQVIAREQGGGDE